MILDRFRVTDRVAIVTGAGRGIGAAAALALAQAGADVVISARSEDQLAKVARDVEACGRRAVVVAADLSDLEGMITQRLTLEDVDQALAALGHGDVVRQVIVHG